MKLKDDEKVRKTGKHIGFFGPAPTKLRITKKKVENLTHLQFKIEYLNRVRSAMSNYSKHDTLSQNGCSCGLCSK